MNNFSNDTSRFNPFFRPNLGLTLVKVSANIPILKLTHSWNVWGINNGSFEVIMDDENKIFNICILICPRLCFDPEGVHPT